MGRWKDGAQCAVMLTFDVDGETLWLSGDITRLDQVGMLSQGTYGPRVAVPLILNLLRQKDLNATFFIPGWTAENHRKSLVSIVEQGHEVGHHGWIHEWPTALTRDEEKEVLDKGLHALRDLTGTDPVGYRSPAWEFSDNTLSLLSEHGFRKYSTNLMSHFIPWLHAESGIIELPVSWLLDDAPFFLYGPGRNSKPIHAAEDVLKIWKEEFRGIYQYGCSILTMHPQIIGRLARSDARPADRLHQHVPGYLVGNRCGSQRILAHPRRRRSGQRSFARRLEGRGQGKGANGHRRSAHRSEALFARRGPRDDAGRA
ncbi:MAG: polysaccharide deacetylase [Thermomicrobiales bacterium]